MVLCNSLALLDPHHLRPICKRHKVAVVHSNNNSNSKCLHNRNLNNSLSVVLVVCTAHQLVLVAHNKLVVYRQVALGFLQVHNNFHRIKA